MLLRVSTGVWGVLSCALIVRCSAALQWSRPPPLGRTASTASSGPKPLPQWEGLRAGEGGGGGARGTGPCATGAAQAEPVAPLLSGTRRGGGRAGGGGTGGGGGGRYVCVGGGWSSAHPPSPHCARPNAARVRLGRDGAEAMPCLRQSMNPLSPPPPPPTGGRPSQGTPGPCTSPPPGPHSPFRRGVAHPPTPSPSAGPPPPRH